MVQSLFLLMMMMMMMMMMMITVCTESGIIQKYIFSTKFLVFHSPNQFAFKVTNWLFVNQNPLNMYQNTERLLGVYLCCTIIKIKKFVSEC
jgi:hypothetical protein